MSKISRSRSSRANSYLCAKDITDKYHITYQTLNHYTDFGLFPVISRTGNSRLYSAKTIDKNFKQINDLRREGYSLRLIRKKLIGI